MLKNRTLLARIAVVIVLMATFTNAPFATATAPLTDNGNVVPDSFLATPSHLTSPSAIQSFLDKKILTCEIAVCINNYNELGVSAATLLFNAASQYNINPEYLVALIQSQTGLITDTTPSANQFGHAAGFSCTSQDGNCQFSKQVSLAAKFFSDAQSGAITPLYQSGSTYTVRFNINEVCGSSELTIKNQATALLYSYNQNFNYQPNQSAITAEYGQGDSCSSYGVRNFHNYAYDWFIAPAPESNSFTSTPVYRFWSPKNQHHFYTASAQERDVILSTYSTQIWTYEGIAFSAPVDSQCQQTSPVYRFWSPKNQSHFFTTSAQERDIVISNYDRSIWTYEGVAYCALPSSSPDGVPVYRFWSNKLQGHFYTTSVQEKNTIQSSYDQDIWHYEGVAYYVK